MSLRPWNKQVRLLLRDEHVTDKVVGRECS